MSSIVFFAFAHEKFASKSSGDTTNCSRLVIVSVQKRHLKNNLPFAKQNFDFCAREPGNSAVVCWRISRLLCTRTENEALVAHKTQREFCTKRLRNANAHSHLSASACQLHVTRATAVQYCVCERIQTSQPLSPLLSGGSRGMWPGSTTFFPSSF